MTGIRIGRRTALAASLAAIASPAVVRAQTDPIKLATLTPLTGAGGSYGPTMAKVAASAVEEVNKAGGVLGRRIVLVSEDDQTSPEAGVRAARKLIEGVGVYLNNQRQVQAQKIITSDDLKWPAAILLRTGKKNYHLVRIK